MKENIFDVLMYIFENQLFDTKTSDKRKPKRSGKVLLKDLKQMGYDLSAIDNVLEWAENLSTPIKNTETYQQLLERNSFRIPSPEEKVKLAHVWGYITYLENIGILDAACRELVIDRLMNFDGPPVDLPEVKWVALMVLFNKNAKEALHALETLILESKHPTLQ